MSRWKSLSYRKCGAFLLTAYVFLYGMTALPPLQRNTTVQNLRRGWLFLHWKVDWKMFAPSPRRTFPTHVLLRLLDETGQNKEEVPLFDFFSIKSHEQIPDFQKIHLALFYYRLWSDVDCIYNCERVLDQLVSKYFRGEQKVVAQLVYLESRIPNIHYQYVSIGEIKNLPRKERVRLEKSYIH